MKTAFILLSLLLVVSLGEAASRQKTATNKGAPVASGTSTNFAPMPKTHDLASIWNVPEFARRLVGSYGFASDAEPRLSPEEQAVYRDKVVPLLREDPRKAMPVLSTLVKPEASAVFDFTLGNIYFQNDDFTNAVKFFEAALAKFPDYRRAQKNLAFALVRDGKYPEAILPLTRTVTLGGGDGKVFGLLGFVYMNQNRFASAEAAYGQALVFEPENVDFKLGAVKCSISTGNYDRGLALLNELISSHPDRELLWTLQANIYIQKEQMAAASGSLEILRRLGKAQPQSLYLLGDLYMNQDVPDLACEAYLQAIDKDGGANPSKALRASQIVISRGAWDEARTLFSKIRSAGKKLSDADELKLLKLESKVALATGGGAVAIGVLEKILERNPLDGEALLLAGDYYAKNEQIEKADFRFDTASKLTGFEAEAFVKRAQLLVRNKKFTQAVEFLQKAQRAKPRDNVQRYLEKIEQLARVGRS